MGQELGFHDVVCLSSSRATSAPFTEESGITRK